MKKFNVIKAAANGFLTLARLGESDQYLLVVTAKDKELFVPYVKIKGSAFAYIDPDRYDIDDYESLTLSSRPSMKRSSSRVCINSNP